MPLSWQAPKLLHVAWLTHSVPASPQLVPAARWLDWQTPEPLQVSGESHWPDEGSPQAVPAVLNPLSWQAPAVSRVRLEARGAGITAVGTRGHVVGLAGGRAVAGCGVVAMPGGG